MTDAQTESRESSTDAPTHGLLAEYPTPGELVHAARQVRDAGFSRWDTYTPFPVHGIDPAMGIKPTVLPWIVLIAGLTGCVTGVWLQWWTNAFDYPWIVSGKPFWSLPANIPIIFELTVLFSAITALVSMLVLNRLPHPSHPLDLKRRFARSTDDKFFLYIEASDPKFDEDDTRELLRGTAPALLEEVPEDQQTPERLPRGVIYALVILGVAALVPFALIAAARASKSSEPRIHPIADMDFQPKFQAQQANSFFEDGRAMRQPVEGTVAIGELRDDDHFYRGKDAAGNWARLFPEELPLTKQTMKRGKHQFGIYCAPCHGLTGNGDGMVNQRAAQLAEGTWIPPTNINQEHIHKQPVGQLFNTITNGIRNMPAYGHLVEPKDRWAIVMYIRALQRRQAATLQDVPPEARASLK